MTIPELNERAARLWMPNNRVTVADDGRAIVGGNYFDPARNPADCAVVKRVMREKGWRIQIYNPDSSGECVFVVMQRSGQPEVYEHGPTEEHAVTIAAVMATEGESK